MKKILSILLSVAMVLSSVCMVVFAVDGAQSENLLPAEISTFDEGGVTTHDNLVYLNGGHIYSKAISEGALKANYYGYAASYTSPMWLLGSYIKDFATNNPATSYTVNVSMDVKGSINSAELAIRRYANASDSTMVTLPSSSATLNSDTYTTMAGSFEITSAEALVAENTWYALCLSNISRPAALGGISFDNVTLKITPVGVIIPDEPVGLLPTEISTFGSNGVTSHDYLVYLNSGHIYTTVLNEGALRVNYQSYAANYTSPMWLLGSYIKDFATNNPATSYTVNVSMDVKGSINSAELAIRRYANASDSTMVTLPSSSATLNSDTYTTMAGSFEITSAEALVAENTWYALCLSNISRPAALGGISFDNIVLEIEAVKGPEAIGFLPIEISVFDKTGVTSHESLYFNDYGSHISSKSIVDGALKVSNASWASADVAPWWYLGSYIKAFAAENPAYSYKVTVSMDVKSNGGTASLVLRNSNAPGTNQYSMLYLESGVQFNADSFTTVGGTMMLTPALINEAIDTSYALCLAGFSAPASSVTYYDNIVLTIETANSNAIEGATLDLGATLTINYFADLDDAHKDAVLKVTRNDSTVEINGVYDETYKMYKFAYTGINPQCMVDNVSASLVFGGEVISEKAEYSVKNYFANVQASDAATLKITEAQFNALIKLANDTLIYGREAQKHMNYNLTELATDNLTWITEDASTLEVPAETFKTVTNTDASNKVASATLNISSAVKVMYRVKLTNKNLTVKINGVEAELVATNNADEYLVYSPALKATEFNNAYTITITDGASEISKVTYSVNDYVAYVAAKGENSSLYNIVKALNNYGISAVAFKNA